MNEFSKYWDKKLPKNMEESTYSVWLDDKIDLMNGCGTRVLDLGCGNGEDTKFLLDSGFDVVSVDFSNSAIKAVSDIKGSKPILFDMSDEKEWEQFADNSFDAVVANLSLHYFDSRTTKMILSNLKRVLKPGDGVLIARLNSSKDEKFGANDGVEVEPNFYINRERGITKRFFTVDTIKEFFSIFEIILVQSKEILYIGKTKQIFEIICKNK